MPTIDEIANGAGAVQTAPIVPVEETVERKSMDLGFLTAQTGEGLVEDYIEHPMNFNGSKGAARVLRGLTGMFGSLNYAIVDILIGAMDLFKTSPKTKFGGINNGNGGVSRVS